ncbi:MAG: hypothetical protein ABL866_11905 [Devosia sp.]
MALVSSKWLKALGLVVVLLALGAALNWQQSAHPLVAAFDRAAVFPRQGVIDLTPEVSNFIPMGMGGSEAEALLAAAGFERASRSDFLFGVEQSADYYDHFQRKARWWSVIFFDVYDVFVGQKDDRVNFLFAQIAVVSP